MSQPTTSTKFVSVVICTRNRSANIVSAVNAVLGSIYVNFELLILDQSDDDKTYGALEDTCARDSRVRYIHLERPGKPGALNRAWQEARGEILVLTDDDCEPSPDWMGNLIAEFDDIRVGAAFGNVDAVPYDEDKVYIPILTISQATTISTLRQFHIMPDLRNFGIGANMAVQVKAVESVGGWDPCIGPGAKFGNGDDYDLTVRLLLAGWAVAFQPAAHVRHYGFRQWKDAKRDIEFTGYGFGATFVKYLRCGKIYYGSVRMLWHFLKQVMVRAISGQRPLGFSFLKGWFRGVFSALNYPVVKATYTFQKQDKGK